MIPDEARGIVAVEELLGTGGPRLPCTYCAAIPRDLAGLIAACMEERRPMIMESDLIATRVLGIMHTFGPGPAVVHRLGSENGYRYYKYGIEHRVGGPSSCYMDFGDTIYSKTLKWEVWGRRNRPNDLPTRVAWLRRMDGHVEMCEAHWPKMRGLVAYSRVEGDIETIVNHSGFRSVTQISE